MPQILDFFAMKTRKSRAKRSKAGRKKTVYFRLNITGCGRDSFILVRPEVVARTVGVSKQTVYHWIAGTKTPAPVTMALMEILLGGTLPWRGWEGWRMDPETGRLIAPNSYSFHSGELAWWSLQKLRITELQRENAELRVQIQTLRAQVQDQAANNLLSFPRSRQR